MPQNSNPTNNLRRERDAAGLTTQDERNRRVPIISVLSSDPTACRAVPVVAVPVMLGRGAFRPLSHLTPDAPKAPAR